ncbi:BRO1-like domain-containing protein [Phlyctochytrium arcticum]|nr:BRO1-like domain-containing protein [Phlyctochytrium arcticum]
MASANASPLLHIATKRTDEVDFTAPFRAYIQNVYQDDPDKYATEIATLHRLRQDTRGAGKDITGRDILYRYYGQLELLDLRFPVDEKHVKVLFTWYDSFSQAAVSQYSIAYEKACTIFNIAATCSSIGALQNRFEAAGLKTAFNYLQAAAGLFLYINDNFLHAPSTDLSRDSIKTLSDLMLGQAQECFIEKVTMEKKKGALVAKLAAQAAHVYQSVADGFSNEAIRAQFDRAWIELVRVKAKHMQALSMYHRSMQAEAENKYGEIVAYLTAAEGFAKEANKLATAFSGSFPSFTTAVQSTNNTSSSSKSHTTAAAVALLEETKTTLNLITEKKAVAIKDNDLIYHDSIPKIETLPPVEKLNAVKPLTFADICTNGQADIPKIIGQDIFQRLVPLSVHESASLYSEEKAKLLRSEQARVESSDQELQATLESMNLVQTLDKLKQLSKRSSSGVDSVPLPEQVRKWSQLVREAEQTGHPTDELVNLIVSVKRKVQEVLNETGLLLDKEQHETETMRSKFGEQWTQEPSVKLTSRFRDDIRQHRESFEKAMSTDGALISGLDVSRSVIDMLRQHPDKVEISFAERVIASAPNNTAGTPIGNLIDETVDGGSGGFGVLNEQILIEKMDGLLSRLRTLKRERHDLIDELKAKLHSDDISSLLLLNKNKETQVFQTELSKFKPLQGRINSNLQLHAQFLRDLSTDFTKLEQSSESLKNVENIEKRKKAIISEWGQSFERWKEAKDGLGRGVEFYSSLCNLVEALRRNVVEFVGRRAEERDRMAQRLEEDLAEQRQRTLREQLQRLSVGAPASGSQAPPPASSPFTQQSSLPGTPLGPSHSESSYRPQPAAPPTDPASQFGASPSPVYSSPPVSLQQQQQPPQQRQSFDAGQYAPRPSMPPSSYGRQEVQPFAPPPPSPYSQASPGPGQTYFPPQQPTSPPSQTPGPYPATGGSTYASSAPPPSHGQGPLPAASGPRPGETPYAPAGHSYSAPGGAPASGWQAQSPSGQYRPGPPVSHGPGGHPQPAIHASVPQSSYGAYGGPAPVSQASLPAPYQNTYGGPPHQQQSGYSAGPPRPPTYPTGAPVPHQPYQSAPSTPQGAPPIPAKPFSARPDQPYAGGQKGYQTSQPPQSHVQSYSAAPPPSSNQYQPAPGAPGPYGVQYGQQQHAPRPPAADQYRPQQSYYNQQPAPASYSQAPAPATAYQPVAAYGQAGQYPASSQGGYGTPGNGQQPAPTPQQQPPQQVHSQQYTPAQPYQNTSSQQQPVYQPSGSYPQQQQGQQYAQSPSQQPLQNVAHAPNTSQQPQQQQQHYYNQAQQHGPPQPRPQQQQPQQYYSQQSQGQQPAQFQQQQQAVQQQGPPPPGYGTPMQPAPWGGQPSSSNSLLD